MLNKLSSLPFWLKTLIVFTIDSSALIFSWWLAFSVRLGVWYPLTSLPFKLLALSLFVFLGLAFYLGAHKTIYRYTGFISQQRLLLSLGIYLICVSTYTLLVVVPGVPRTVGFIHAVLFSLATVCARFFMARLLERVKSQTDSHGKFMLLYGINFDFYLFGTRLSELNGSKVIDFICENKIYVGRHIDGLVISGPECFEKLLVNKSYDAVLIDSRSMSDAKIRSLEETGAKFSVPTLIFDGHGLALSPVGSDWTRTIENAKLLGRKQVPPDLSLIAKSTAGKVILITGAGGSIGGELCQQAIVGSPRKIILYDHSEIALYTINQKLKKLLKEHCGYVEIVPILGSVLDRKHLKRVFKTFEPDVVFHAAAYKHVELLEFNTTVAVQTNVLGTYNCLTTALESNTRSFVLISSDKAVNPTNLMGATKRLAELVVLCCIHEIQPSCKASVVRFGNVLGSSGSVIPKFLEQIAEGGPVTVTHPEVERFFMTIREATQLVIQAASLAQGGETFVLDMGSPVKILDLAHRMIELAAISRNAPSSGGERPEIVFCGLAKGEKLFEELFIGDDVRETKHPKILVSREPFDPSIASSSIISTVKSLDDLNLSDKEVKEVIKNIIPEYRPDI